MHSIISKTPASKGFEGPVRKTRLRRAKRTAGKENIRSQKEKHDHQVSQDGVFAIRKIAFDSAFHINSHPPTHAAINPPVKPGIPAYPARSKKHMTMRRRDSSTMRDLRFSSRRSVSLGFLRLRLGLGNLLSLLWCICWSSFSVSTIRRGPEGEVVSEQLHDESAITV